MRCNSKFTTFGMRLVRRSLLRKHVPGKKKTLLGGRRRRRRRRKMYKEDSNGRATHDVLPYLV